MLVLKQLVRGCNKVNQWCTGSEVAPGLAWLNGLHTDSAAGYQGWEGCYILFALSEGKFDVWRNLEHYQGDSWGVILQDILYKSLKSV